MTRDRCISTKALWLWALVFVVVQIAFVWLWVVPGPMSLDEVLYHRMVKNLVDGHGLTIWNGYRDFPSPELTARYLMPSDGRLVAQYPYGFPVIAAPFYTLFGYRGLFFVNAIAFVGAVVLCYRIALQLLDDQRVALSACAIFVGATFAWEYSQAVWPHAFALLLTLGFISLGINAYRASSGARAVRNAVAAGFVAGIGCTVRLDVALCVLALMLPFLLTAPVRVREIAAIVGGMIPGITLLAVSNWIKWGTLLPFSYGINARGGNFSRHLPLMIVGACVVGVLVAVTRTWPKRWLAADRRRLMVVMVGIFVAAFLVPDVRAQLFRFARGIRAILIDLRELPHDSLAPAMVRTPTGGLNYWGGYKKSLLQSMPYLVLIVVPVLLGIRDRRLRWPIWILALVPVTLGSFFSYYAWHGGLCYNMRYLLPALPFLSILCAIGLLEIIRGAMIHWGWLVVSAVVILAVHVLIRPAAAIEPFVYLVPLLLALFLAVTLGVWALRPSRSSSIGVMLVAGACLGWGGAIGFTYDSVLSRQHRAKHQEVSAFIAQIVAPDSLLFVDFPDPYYGIVEYRDRVRVATPVTDQFHDAGPLLRHHIKNGRRVYAILPPTWWPALEGTGALAGMVVQSRAHVGSRVLVEIRPE